MAAAPTTTTTTTTASSSSSKPISESNPVLIIRAGIVGLTLAHALAQSSIPFRIYDRDTHLTSRGPGWAISIHWARPALAHCLPAALLERVENAQVCPGTNDIGRFLFLDLATAVPKYEIPSAPLLRLNRGRFREVLSDGVDVRWGKRLEGFDVRLDGGVEVVFADGETVAGALLVGADGAGSRVRQLLCPDTWALNRLPIRMLGATATLTESQFAPLREIHPMLFQGCHPETGTYMWFSIISVPETNGSATTAKPFYEGQINLSWRVKTEEEEPPASSEDKLKMMKRLAKPFERRLRTAVEELPEGNVVTEIRLQDWPAVQWLDHGGATLIGDAAHAMTMYRGEACNHGIVDAQMLHDTISSFYDEQISQTAALEEFDKQVMTRTRDGVLLSRQACLDAHDFHGLKNDSPLVSKRALIRTPGMDVSKR